MATHVRWGLRTAAVLGAVLAGGTLPAAEGEGPKPGFWTLTGTGNTGDKWEATFNLKRSGQEYTGAFEWSTQGSDAGTESFQGAYDAAKKLIVLRGLAAKGQVEKGQYTATVSADGKSLTNGKWTGTSDGTQANPGRWEAAWSGNARATFEKKLYTDAKGNQLPYRLLAPDDYDPQTAYPLVLFLHGAGERGADNQRQLWTARELATPRPRSSFPCFVAAPQCPGKRPLEYWGPTVDSGLVLGLIKEVEKNCSIDPKRIYITGLSDGGWGVWALLARYPNRFAAAVPICGGGDASAAERFAKVPIWVFHGKKDDVEPVKSSRTMVAALEKAGGTPKYTEYPNVAHNSWDLAYKEPKLFEWLFAQKRE